MVKKKESGNEAVIPATARALGCSSGGAIAILEEDCF